MSKINKQFLKKNPEELEAFLQFKRKGSKVEAKKGKGSFKRHSKHRNDDYSQCA